MSEPRANHSEKMKWHDDAVYTKFGQIMVARIIGQSIRELKYTIIEEETKALYGLDVLGIKDDE